MYHAVVSEVLWDESWILNLSSSRCRDMGIRFPLLWMDVGLPAMKVFWCPASWFRKSSACMPLSPSRGGAGLLVFSMSQSVRLWSLFVGEELSEGESLILIPPLPLFRLEGNVGGRSILRGMGVFLDVCWGCFSGGLESVGGVEMVWSMTATAWEQISPVLLHWMRGQVVSTSVDEFILMVTRVGLAPERSDPVMMLAFCFDSMTAPCL